MVFFDNPASFLEYLLACLKCSLNDKASSFNAFWLLPFNHISVDCKEFYLVSTLDKKAYNLPWCSLKNNYPLK